MTPTDIRLWPGAALAIGGALLWIGAPIVSGAPLANLVAVLAGALAAVAIIVWWVAFSRAPRLERWGVLGLIIVALAVVPRLLHVSIAEGNLGFQYFLFAVPTVGFALVAAAAAGQRLPTGARRGVLIAAVVVASGVWGLMRSDGVTGDGMPELTWRWSATAEERLLAATEVAADVPVVAPDKKMQHVPAAWPGLRGPNRDGVVRGVRVATDWDASPPVELWRRPVGPGVSSFAVVGDVVVTQEQRGDVESVTAYRLGTGEPVWQHRDDARFWDSHVGAGPRATPAIGNGRVYTLGATGVLNALDAATGAVIWSRQAAPDTEANLGLWGFTSSPLVVGDAVVVYTTELVAYEQATGEPRWVAPAIGGSHGSPQLVTIDGAPQVVLIAHDGIIGVDPADGRMLWEHECPGIGMVQPAVVGDDLIFSMADAGASPVGTGRIAVSRRADRWIPEEIWTSTALKPSFSPLVVHDGHAYGFDGRILAAIDTADGSRAWKGGRYGAGQVLLLPDSNALLVVSEQGDLALVEASPDGYAELARMPAIEGKSWSQPALVGDTLLIRNGVEMAAFRLATR